MEQSLDVALEGTLAVFLLWCQAFVPTCLAQSARVLAFMKAVAEFLHLLRQTSCMPPELAKHLSDRAAFHATPKPGYSHTGMHWEMEAAGEA